MDTEWSERRTVHEEQSSQRDRPAIATDIKWDRPEGTGPEPERQAELRSAYEANVAAGNAPYEGVWIQTAAELYWVMQERRWTGNILMPEGYERTNLSEAVLDGANLSRAFLVDANLIGAHLNSADLSGAFLETANLSGAELGNTNLSGTILRLPT